MPLLLRLSVFCLTTLLSVSLVNPTIAQDMRVYTSLADVSQGTENPRVISHSLTLFHAGKVYDYMEEAGEVVVFEPVHHRFVILGKDYIATEVPFAEINHFLDSARTESMSYLAKLKPDENEKAARLEALIRFQFAPEFQKQHDQEQKLLELTSDHINYSVRTARLESPQYVRQYLDYTDWAARLNFVMRPNSTYPESRLKLNDTLRKLELLPIQVDLHLQMNDPVHLRAEHQFAWEFQSVDRKHISHWERVLRSDDVRWIPFRQYQQQVLAQKSK